MSTPIPNATSVIEVVTSGLYAGQAVVNIAHLTLRPATIPAGATPTLESLMAAWVAGWRAAVLPKVCAGYIVRQYQMTDYPVSADNPIPTVARPRIASPGGTFVIAGNPVTDAGTAIGDPLPAFNAAVVRKGTGSPLRRWRGSFHFGPISESDTLGQNLTALSAAAWTSAWTTLVTSGFDAGTVGGPCIFELCVLTKRFWLGIGSPPAGTVPRTNFTRPVTSCTANTLIGSLLHRKNRRPGGA